MSKIIYFILAAAGANGYMKARGGGVVGAGRRAEHIPSRLMHDVAVRAPGEVL